MSIWNNSNNKVRSVFKNSIFHGILIKFESILGPSPAQGTIAPEANHMNPNPSKGNSQTGSKTSNPNSITVHPTTSNDPMKMDVDPLSLTTLPAPTSVPATTSVPAPVPTPIAEVKIATPPLLTTFELPASGMLDLNLKKIVINVPKIKVSLEEQKKMLELKSENIQPESNCLDMFSQMKADGEFKSFFGNFFQNFWEFF